MRVLGGEHNTLPVARRSAPCKRAEEASRHWWQKRGGSKHSTSKSKTSAGKDNDSKPSNSNNNASSSSSSSSSKREPPSVRVQARAAYTLLLALRAPHSLYRVQRVRIDGERVPAVPAADLVALATRRFELRALRQLAAAAEAKLARSDESSAEASNDKRSDDRVRGRVCCVRWRPSKHMLASGPGERVGPLHA